MTSIMYERAGFLNQVERLGDKVDALYVYGAGVYGHNIYKILSDAGIPLSGFLVSHRDTQQNLKIPAFRADSFKGKNIGVILGLNAHNSAQVQEYLRALDFPEEHIIDGGKYLEHGTPRLGFQGDPIMEITVRIGCPVNCRFCPQKNLLKSYFAKDKKRPAMMTMDVYHKCLAKIPKEVGIIFSGFAEVCTHPDCYEMIQTACEDGRHVDFYTTTVGATLETIKKIASLPINYVTLHCADEEGYAKIPLTDEYYEKVSWLINSRKTGSKNPFVDSCNSQAEPDSRVKAICQEKNEICTSIFDRAGNLHDQGLISKYSLKGKLECSMCGRLTNRNVLLPDGTVVLCCMDYSLKHPFGNLLHESYEEILESKEAKRVRKGLIWDEGEDILCRNCTCARIID